MLHRVLERHALRCYCGDALGLHGSIAQVSRVAPGGFGGRDFRSPILKIRIFRSVALVELRASHRVVPWIPQKLSERFYVNSIRCVVG